MQDSPALAASHVEPLEGLQLFRAPLEVTLPGETATDGDADTAPPSSPNAPGLFEEAVQLHARRLLTIARSIVGNRASAEDVVQQAITNLFQHRDRYDWGRPAQAGALLRRAVVNESLRLLRQPRMTAVSDDHPDGASGRPGAGSAHGAYDSPVTALIDRETIQRVRRAIDRLPENFRAALVLCEYESMSYAQIAEVLGASIPQVKTWLHRARRQLAEMLQEFMAADGRVTPSRTARATRSAELDPT